MKLDWLSQMNEEDRSFIKRFVLASGSLKEMAKAYGVSYPTVRLRLDRLIEKIRVLDELSDQTAFERTVRLLAADGKLDPGTMRAILNAHAGELKQQQRGEST